MNKKLFPALIPLRSLAFILIFVIGSNIVGKSLEEISNWWSVAATALNILTVLLLVLLTHSCGSSYRELINYRKGRTTAKQVIAVCAVIMLMSMGGMYLAGFICYGKFPYMAPKIIAPIPAALAAINALLLPVTTALAEDGLYLGCGVNQIKSKWAAILFSSFFFALQHSFIPTLFDARHILYRFLSFLPLTVILCLHYHKHRNPLPIMIGHGLIDAATVSMIIITSFSPDLYEKWLSM